MSGDLQAASRDKRGRMLPGNNSRTIKQARIAARLWKNCAPSMIRLAMRVPLIATG